MPCQAVLSPRAPAGHGWIHEVKHDGFRLIALKRGEHVRLWTRQASDYTNTFTGIAAAIKALPAGSCILDGEAVCYAEAAYDFHALRSREGGRNACLIAFDLLEIEGKDLRANPLEERRASLCELLEAQNAITFSAEIPGDGPEIFQHACAMGLEGIVSKRLGSRYKSGSSQDWIKTKNPDFVRHSGRG